MKKRILAISDIHGCHSEFNALLNKVKFNPVEDELILMGDYVDRGIKSKQVVEQVMNLVDEHNITVLLGNHDQMMLDAFMNHDEEDSYDDILWVNNGGLLTIESYIGSDWFTHGFDWQEYVEAKKFIVANYHQHLNFLRSLKLYHETDFHIFVHAGIDPYFSDWKKSTVKDFIWNREPFLSTKITNTNDKIVVVGHTPVETITGNSDVFADLKNSKIYVDGACAYGRQLNCLIIEDNDYKFANVKKGDFI